MMMKELPETSANKKSGARRVYTQSFMDSSAKSNSSVKEAEDISQAQRFDKLKLFDNLSEIMKQERRSPRGEAPFGNVLEISKQERRSHRGETDDKTGAVSEAPTPAKAKGASPPTLSRFMKAQPEPSANKVVGSRSVQHQPPTDLSAKSKKVKEAEEVRQGSQQKRSPRAPPQKRAPPRATKSLDENQFKSVLGRNRGPIPRKIEEDTDKISAAYAKRFESFESSLFG
jgi:hypothetical protein